MSGISSVRDVVIVGAGPSGLTAAVYTSRALRHPLVLEKALPGGQLNETDLIENWPGTGDPVPGPELMTKLRQQAERLGAEIVQDEVKSIEVGGALHRIYTERAALDARSVIVCPGSRPRELDVPGAARLKGRGVSYCATCDGYFFRDRSILVVGAGDSALMEALFLTRFATRVSVVVRHPQDAPAAVRASASMRRRAEENPKIEFLWNCAVLEILGDASVRGARLKQLDSGAEQTVAADAVFVNIGRIPETDFLRGAVGLDGGYIVTDERLRTDVPGIFAAGDARRGTHRYSQAVIAAGEGAVAALEAEQYLSHEAPRLSTRETSLVAADGKRLDEGGA
jgi:thioredoxin reductase (NADPH)